MVIFLTVLHASTQTISYSEFYPASQRKSDSFHTTSSEQQRFLFDCFVNKTAAAWPLSSWSSHRMECCNQLILLSSPMCALWHRMCRRESPTANRCHCLAWCHCAYGPFCAYGELSSRYPNLCPENASHPPQRGKLSIARHKLTMNKLLLSFYDVLRSTKIQPTPI